MSNYTRVMTWVDCDPAVVLAGVPYFVAQQPAFIDQSLEARAVTVARHSLAEFRALCQKHAVYVLDIKKCDSEDDVYTFRYVALPEVPQALLLDEVEVGDVYLHQTAFLTARLVTAKVNYRGLYELNMIWGRAEVVRQLGEQLLKGLTSAGLLENPDDQYLSRQLAWQEHPNQNEPCINQSSTTPV